MKIKISIITVLVLLMIAACKKYDNTIILPQEPETQIATIKQTIKLGFTYDLTKELFYDNQGRLKEIKYSGSNSGMEGERYTYGGNMAQYRYHIAGAEDGIASADYTLGSNGLAREKLYPVLQIKDQFEFNNAGFITRQNFIRHGSGDGYAIYHYSGNNLLDSISGFTFAGTKTVVQVFTYETGKQNTIGNENMGLKMLGKDQAIPLETKTVFTYQNGVRRMTSKNEYTNILYPDGRIKRVTNRQTDYPPGATPNSFIIESLEFTYK